MENNNTEAVEVAAEVIKTDISMEKVYNLLCEKVTDYNAKLLMRTAAVNAGISNEMGDYLNKDEAQALCLELIKNGGPAFHVGKNVYNTIQ